VGVVGTPDELFVLFAGLRWPFEISIKSQGDTSPYRKLYQQKRKRSALDSIGGLNMANCGGLHNSCENKSLEHFKQVWQKSFIRKRGAAL